MITAILAFLLLVWMGFSGYAVLSVFLTKPRDSLLGKVVWWYGVVVLAAATLVAAASILKLLSMLVQALFGEIHIGV